MPTPRKWFTVDIDCTGAPFEGGRTAYSLEIALRQVMDGLRIGLEAHSITDDHANKIGQWKLHERDETKDNPVAKAARHFSVYINCDGPKFRALAVDALLTALANDLQTIIGNVRTARWSGAVMTDEGFTYGNWKTVWT